MRQDAEALHQLAKIAIEGPPAKETLSLAAGIICRATEAAEAMLVYAEDQDFLTCTDAGDGAGTEFTNIGLSIVQRQIMELGGPVAFNLIGHRVEDLASAVSDNDRDFLAWAVPTSQSPSEMCILRGPQKHEARAAIPHFIESAMPALTVILERFLNADRSRRQGEQLHALADAAQVLSQSENLEASLTNLATAIAGPAGVDFVNIDLWDANIDRFVLRIVSESRFSSKSLAQAWRGSLDPERPEAWKLEIMRTHQPALAPDVQNDERVEQQVREFFRLSLIRSVALFPILFQDEFLGTMGFVSFKPRTFPAEEVGFLQGFVAQVATALKALQLHGALRESEERFRSLSDSAPIGIFLTDSPGNCTYANPRLQAIAGLTLEQSLGFGWSQVIHPDDRQAMLQAASEAARERREFSYEIRMVTPEGELRWTRVHTTPMFSADGRQTGRVGTMEDITERKRAEEALRESEELHRLTLTSISDAVFITDEAGVFTFICPNVDVVFGYSFQEVQAFSNIGKLLGDDLFDPNELEASGELRNIEREVADKAGRQHALLVNVKRVSIKSGTVLYACRDITERKQMEEELRVRAITDSLTGLYDHAHFYRRLGDEIERSKRYNHGFAVLMLDVDDFKRFNDSRGHQAGDEALRLIGDCIRSGLRRSDLAFRYGGDEFAAILPHADSSKARAVVNRMNRRIAKSLSQTHGGAADRLSLSAGIACFPSDGTTADALVRVADSALYNAKWVARARDIMGQREDIQSFVSGLVGRRAGVKALASEDAFRPEALHEEQARIVSGVASSITMALIDAGVSHAFEDPDLQVLALVGAAAEIKDRHIRGHPERTSEQAVFLAEEMGLSPEQVRNIRIAGLLHDIGKVTVSEGILNKPGKLTKREFSLIKDHPIVGATLVSQLKGFERVVPIIRHHHERFDGKGYPDGLAGEDIPLEARILSVVDVFDAMTHERAYRKAMSSEQAVAELERGSGTRFDPAVMEPFLALLKRQGEELAATAEAASEHRPLAATRAAGRKKRTVLDPRHV